MASKLFKRAGLALALALIAPIFAIPLSLNDQDVPCGLTGVPSNSSETNPIILASIPGNISSGVEVWSTKFFGRETPAWVELSNASDVGYLDLIIHGDGRYQLLSTPITSKLPYNKNRTFIKSYSRLYCQDWTLVPYFFHVPIDVQQN